MTFKKYLYLIITSLFLATSFAEASVTGPGSSRTNQKITIIGHTGQDPVYKSIGGKDKHTPPINEKPIIVDTQYFDFTNSYLEENLLANNWLTSQHYGGSFYSSADWGDSEFNYTSSQIGNHFANGSIPAPPAFLLLLSGFLVKSRRKP